MLKPALLLNAAGTLRFVPPEGPPDAGSSPAVVLYDEVGTQWTGSAVTASLSGDSLVCTVPAALADACAENYRASWTYSVGGSSYTRSQTWEVVRAVLYPTLTAEALTAAHYPLLAGRGFPDPGAFDRIRATAWERLHAMIRARGKSPHKIIDPAPLEPVHAALTAAAIARNYRPGGAQVDWQAWALDREREASDLFDGILASLAWYDETDDLQPDAGEQRINAGRVRLGR